MVVIPWLYERGFEAPAGRVGRETMVFSSGAYFRTIFSISVTVTWSGVLS